MRPQGKPRRRSVRLQFPRTWNVGLRSCSPQRTQACLRAEERGPEELLRATNSPRSLLSERWPSNTSKGEPLLEGPGDIGPGDWAESEERKRSRKHADLPPLLLPASGLQEGPDVRLVLGQRRPSTSGLPSWPIRDGPGIEEG